jgi:hypothetical protein
MCCVQLLSGEGVGEIVSGPALDKATQKIRLALDRNAALSLSSLELSIDAQSLARLLGNDREAVAELSDRWGVDPTIMRLVVALGRGDRRQLIDALIDLCSKPAISTKNTDLVLALFSLGGAVRRSESALAVKSLFNSVFKMCPDSVLFDNSTFGPAPQRTMLLQRSASNLSDAKEPEPSAAAGALVPMAVPGFNRKEDLFEAMGDLFAALMETLHGMCEPSVRRLVALRLYRLRIQTSFLLRSQVRPVPSKATCANT